MSSFRFGSHLPVLMKIVERTDKPILELGSGFYSTVYLHWACFHTKRKLVTLENSKEYYRMLKNLTTDWHNITLVDDWHTADVKGDWGVVLIDQSPGQCRGRLLPRFTQAEYVLCHDSDDTTCKYDFSPFKYRFLFDPVAPRWFPKTMVLSNIHNLEGLMDD